MSNFDKAVFLNGEPLADCIRYVCAGKKVRCAVAFWGKTIAKEIPKNAKIICDISMGATSDKALIILGAPDNRKVRHIKGLHSKVYLSDRGVVIGSANASLNALGDTHERWAVLTEAGVFHPFDSGVFAEVSLWFSELYKTASVIDENALKIARQICTPPRRPTLPSGNSLLELVCSAPEKFSDMSFVFTNSVTSRERRQQIIDYSEDKGNTTGGEIERNHQGFCDWDAKDLENWKKSFVNYHIGPKRVYVGAYSAAHYITHSEKPKKKKASMGSVFATKNWSKLFPSDQYPTQTTVEKCDEVTARKIFEKTEGGIFDARKLASIIERLQC